MQRVSSRTLRVAAIALIAVLGAASVEGQVVPRLNLPPGGSNWVPNPQPQEMITTTDLNTLTPAQLVAALIGPGVATSNITYVGAPIAAGTFSGGAGIIGFNSGIVLGSGNIASTAGPNVADNTTTNNGQPGDADLNALTTSATFDASILEFDFSCAGTNVISFQYVFTSEEYNEFVNSNFNDVFAFFVNGVNIAIVPATVNTPVTINNVNCGNPYSPPGGGSNCGSFVNNDLQDGGGAINTEMDGLTLVFTATAVINPGTNHIKIAIADAGDSAWDSNVFILGSSFQCALPGPVFEPPTPGLCLGVPGQMANVGTPYSHVLDAIATNGLAGQNVTISALIATTKNGNPIAFPGNASHAPALPVTGQPALSTLNWTPNNSQVGTWQFTYFITDQLGATGSCTIEVIVAECYLIPALAPTWVQTTFGDVLLVDWDGSTLWSVTETSIPTFAVPNNPAYFGLTYYLQVAMWNPLVFPNDPLQLSNGLAVTLGTGAMVPYGPNSGITLWSVTPPTLGANFTVQFDVLAM